MLYVLVAHRPNRYDRRHNEYTEGVFVCEEHYEPATLNRRLIELMSERDFDDDDLFVYEIAGRDGDDYFNADGEGPNIAGRLMNAVRSHVKAEKAAAEQRAEAQRRTDEANKRVAAEKAEREYYERLKAKYEGA